jgi:hypothetical protein
MHKTLRAWLNRFWGVVPADPVDSVEVGRGGLTVRVRSDSHCVPWNEVETISIQYVGGSSAPEKTHFVFRIRNRGLRVALSTPGMSDLVQRLHHVPGVDRQAYTRAMEVIEDKPVEIWRNPDKASSWAEERDG